MPITTLTTEARNAATAAVLLTTEIYNQLDVAKFGSKVGAEHMGLMAATLAASIMQDHLDQPGQISAHQIGR